MYSQSKSIAPEYYKSSTSELEGITVCFLKAERKKHITFSSSKRAKPYSCLIDFGEVESDFKKIHNNMAVDFPVNFYFLMLYKIDVKCRICSTTWNLQTSELVISPLKYNFLIINADHATTLLIIKNYTLIKLIK